VKDVFDRVRELAEKLPEAEESTHYGTPAFKVRKKMFVRLHELGDVLVVRRSLPERAVLIEAEPHKNFFMDHYNDYPAMLVRLPAVSREELRDVITAAYRFVAPPALAELIR
jgi:hypothetical protein